MKVWIMEKDHKPMVNSRQQVLSYPEDIEGTAAMKQALNSLQTNREVYYDAVLYERIEAKVQNLESK